MARDFTNDTVIHVKKDNGLEYIQFRKLLEYEDTLKHVFTTRHGGVSVSPFDSLNFGLKSIEPELDGTNSSRNCNASLR